MSYTPCVCSYISVTFWASWAVISHASCLFASLVNLCTTLLCNWVDKSQSSSQAPFMTAHIWLICSTQERGKREKRREPRHPSCIVRMISFWVIILVPQHSETHPQVINPRLSGISSSGSQETCRINVVMWESWRGPEWCHLLDSARNLKPDQRHYSTSLYLHSQLR